MNAVRRIPPPEPPYVGPPKFHGGEGNKPIYRVVIHSTVSPCVPGGARNIANYFKTTDRPSSAHYVTDPAETIQAAYDSLVCYHAPPNTHSLGVEMCDMPGPRPKAKPGTVLWRKLRQSWRWAKPNQRRMLRRTARLTAQLCLAYGVPIRWCSPAMLRRLDGQPQGITSHANVGKAWHETTHWDPGWWPRAWFMFLVRRHARRLTSQK